MQAAARAEHSTKKRMLDAPTEEAALEILLIASSAETRKRKQSKSEHATRADGSMSGSVPVKVCPAHG